MREKAIYHEKGYCTEKTLGECDASDRASHLSSTYVSDDQGSSYTYGEIDDKAARLAAWVARRARYFRGRGHVQMPTWAGVLHRLCGSPRRRAVMHPSAQLSTTLTFRVCYGMNCGARGRSSAPPKWRRSTFESQILSIVDQIPTLHLWRFVIGGGAEAPEPPTVAEICALRAN